mmetsp:Transcript_16240/g.32930  ORF Transcript_16240/g.32930 Transcript_16240/m.32930 type:complete len:171 (-) Transcript_16240:1444-1956(-)
MEIGFVGLLSRVELNVRRWRQGRAGEVDVQSRQGSSYTCPAVVGLAPGVKVGRPKISIQKDAKKLHEPSKPQNTEVDAGAKKAIPLRKTQTDEVPMYKVILMGDEDYDENHVVTQLIKIVQLDKKEAQRIYIEAQQLGESLVCVVTQEHAEFYAQQLKRQEIFIRVEEDV